MIPLFTVLVVFKNILLKYQKQKGFRKKQRLLISLHNFHVHNGRTAFTTTGDKKLRDLLSSEFAYLSYKQTERQAAAAG